MEYIIFAAMVIALALLLYRLLSIRLSLKEIQRDMPEKLKTDTNTLLTVSTGDSQVRQLAAFLNQELRELTKERRRLQSGDLELKEAITNISHDLRTPLTAISGYLDLLEQEELSTQTQQYVTVIRERTRAMTAMTEELFRYSMVTSENKTLKLEPVDVGSVLEQSLAAFYAVFTEHGIVPQIDLPETKVVRLLNQTALLRIFHNLLNNVLRYSDGDLSVSLHPEGEICFSNRAASLNAVAVDKLFHRFYTVETARKSTGLGLSIARTLTQRIGGTIHAEFHDGRLFIYLNFPNDSRNL